MITRLEDVEVGEALPVGIRGTSADLAKMAGASVVGRISLNGGTTSVVGGVLFDTPDADGFVGVVPFAGSLLSAKGSVKGSVTITLESEVWSPQVVQFQARVVEHV